MFDLIASIIHQQDVLVCRSKTQTMTITVDMLTRRDKYHGVLSLDKELQAANEG